MRLFVVAFCAFVTFVAANTPVYCVAPQPLTASFCNTPPVVPELDLTQYTGLWYQIYTSGTPVTPTSRHCATANYTLAGEGDLDVLSCHTPPGATQAQCRRETGTRLVGGRKPQLQVLHGADMQGSYNVAALLGDAESGYEAAAVYSCAESREGAVQGIVMLARDPKRANVALEGLVGRMKCLGYTVEAGFEETIQDGCKYFEDGFAEVNDFEEGDGEVEERTDVVIDGESEVAQETEDVADIEDDVEKNERVKETRDGEDETELAPDGEAEVEENERVAETDIGEDEIEEETDENEDQE